METAVERAVAGLAFVKKMFEPAWSSSRHSRRSLGLGNEVDEDGDGDGPSSCSSLPMSPTRDLGKGVDVGKGCFLVIAGDCAGLVVSLDGFICRRPCSDMFAPG